MYLTGKVYLSEYIEDEKKISKEIQKLFPDIDFKVQEVEFNIHSWRKCNAIHKWFVENVQEGNDNCGTYYVGWEQLEELLKIINEILGYDKKDKREKILITLDGIKGKIELARKLLPTSSGFFFGDTEYDDYYFQDLEDTKKMIEKLLNNKDYERLNLYYSSSW